jgi:hypothetical protein
MEVQIISQGRKSDLYGAQYLHMPIPRVTPEYSVLLGYHLKGSSDDYRLKVYGKMWNGTVSPEDLEQSHRAWDIRATYDILWSQWEPYITPMDLRPFDIKSILESPEPPDLIINSIPRPALCHAGHAFGATEIWAAGDAPALGIRLPYQCPENSVTCNGEDSPSWYRLSNVFGHTTVEWPGTIPAVPVNTAARVRKPTEHNCTCWADAPMLHVGRYGEWAKGVLSHTAYFNAFKKTQEALAQGALF